ncbi:MAG: Spy/CpxP family protein refolding chaperone [Chloracidobacterium sp.]|uniref:Spy/CpxP family protein refolding chaperone n=1 Tax=Chloracidobacterium validum TaxID=2821543 RepID=A0ABX8BBW0_9BACT|nr:Spy/CpxP family protein refolding chaperone [Chloracidobacterium validum]QUW04189.1 Spy/CpxP family protein refolding chaperone [Chloracidobacterium validum]
MVHRLSLRPLAVAFALALTLTGVLGGVAYAAGRDRGPGHFMGFFMKRMAAELNLTEEQQAQIRQILETERATAEPLMKQLKAGHDQLRTLGLDGIFNEAQVRVIAQQQAQTMTELIVSKERVKAQVAAVLTPEQRERAKQMLDRFHQRMREHRGHRGPGFGRGPLPPM